MNIAVVDTNPARRKELVTTLKSMYPTDSFAIFSDTASVIDYVGKTPQMQYLWSAICSRLMALYLGINCI